MEDDSTMPETPEAGAPEAADVAAPEAADVAAPEPVEPMGTTEQAIASQTEAAVEPVAEASSVLLPELTPKATGQSISHLGLVLDVGVEVSAVIGQRHLTIEQILGVGPGTVIDLDRVAGEPVALQVNGKPIARAEIVVLDGRLGARVIEVLDSPLQRPDSTQPSEES